jgi:metallo-beta-lactamase family protein
MKLTFYGAAGSVTGSKHMIQVHNFNLLLDCGLYQGPRSETELNNKELPFDASSVGACILSHAHVDHCGMLPVLVKSGFHGGIYTTTATADVVKFLLADAAKIQEQDAIFHNDRLRAGEDPIYPLYTQEDVDAVIPHFKPTPYFRLQKQWHQIAPGVKLKLYDAGHILGSAMPVLELSEQGRTTYVAFSGDLGQQIAPLLPPPEQITEPIETLILECTYGDKIHTSLDRTYEDLEKVIKRTYDRGGKVIIPAFSLGRTQSIIYMLHQLNNAGKLPNQKIYIDSPLAEKLLSVFIKHPEDYDQETWEDFPPAMKEKPFEFKNLVLVESPMDSRKLNDLTGPAVIISASGMCEGGRIVHHLRHHASNPNNTILFTGYQAEHTLGRKIKDGMSPVRIMGQQVMVNAERVSSSGLSAHADRDGLLKYVATMEKTLRRVYLVHTEMPQALAFKALLHDRYPNLDVIIPKFGDSKPL